MGALEYRALKLGSARLASTRGPHLALARTVFVRRTP